jgi:hypothetical protein
MMKLKNLKLDYEKAKRKSRTPLMYSFIQGGQDVFTLTPDSSIYEFKSELRKQTRLLEAYRGVVFVLNDDANRVGHDMKSAMMSVGALDKNHSGLWTYSLDQNNETEAKEYLAHVHTI